MTSPSQVGVAPAQPPADEVTVRPVSELSKMDKLTQAVEQLMEQVGRLQWDAPRRVFSGECWTCQQRGHVARNCPQTRTSQ